METCKIDGCGKPIKTKGWCDGHYKKYWRYGDPLATGQLAPNGLTREELFLRKVDKSDPDGCWRWKGKVNRRGRGYGDFTYKDPETKKPKTEPAHRFAYKLWVGPIRDGYQIDHVFPRCTHTDCVRPDHLEAVTPEENTRRYLLSLTTCRAGHSYAEFGVPGTTGMRCTQCRRESTAAYWRRNNPGTPPPPLKPCCKYGHEFTEENTRMRGNTRICRRCARDAVARAKAAQRATTS